MGTNKNLDFFFNPGSVAIVGASERPGKISRIILESLAKTGFKGSIYPVNPKYDTVAGLKCYPSLSVIGEAIDVAVLALPAENVPEALMGCAGIAKGAIIVSGGFAEVGGKGKELEKAVREISKKEGIRVIGPNCMGIYDAISRLDTFFIPPERIQRPKAGGLSIISQSGSFAITAMDELAAEGIGVARVVSYGNKSDVNEADCLDFLADDEATKAVAIYIESVEEGRKFVEAASRCCAKKPVMAIKVGKAGAGITAAGSHTGAIAGRYEVYRAAFKKAGIIELGGYEEFTVACKAFGMQNEAKGNRVMIITDGGGMGVGIADACFELGLEVPPLTEELKKGLKPMFPPYFSVSNPIDLTGSATDEWYADALEKTMAGDNYDMAIVAALWGPPALTDRLPDMLARKRGFGNKPVIICSPGGVFSRSKLELFRKAGLPVFSSPEAAVRAAAVLAKGAKAKRGRS
ncbi:MAG: CoA-binding protein [Deltaproteobacteria bacterium]|nr:CoA-binding protein [Deltaproteobacteria bacterium]